MTTATARTVQRFVALTAATVTLAAAQAGAQMTLLVDNRGISAIARSVDQEVNLISSPSQPFGVWNDSVYAYVEGGDPEEGNYADAFAFIASASFSGALYAAGHTVGNLQGPGEYFMISQSETQFGLDQCVEFTLDATMMIPDPRP